MSLRASENQSSRRVLIGVCMILLAAGAAGHAWAASYGEIDLTNTAPTDIDMFGDILYVLDDAGWIYTYTGIEWDSSITLKLHANNVSPAGILAYDYDTIYVLDKQGMVFVYGTDPDVILLHPENNNPVAIAGYDDMVYVADSLARLYVYNVQPDGKWVYDSIIALPVPNVSPTALYVHDRIVHVAYVATGTVHVFEHTGSAWRVPYTISLEEPQASMDLSSQDGYVYVLDGSIVYKYDASGNPIIEYDIILPATDPAGISVFDGQFYILDGTHVYQSNTWDIVAEVSETSTPTGLFVHDDIGVYVSDDTSDAIYVNGTLSILLHPDNTNPSGITYQDDVAYVSDSSGHVYVYNVQPDGESTYESTIILYDGNQSPAGVTINNEILYVVDDTTHMIYGYAGKHWSLVGAIPLQDDNANPAGIASYGSRLYVVDGNSVVYSYVNTIDSWTWSHDIPLHSGNQDPVDISIVDGSIHVTDGAAGTLYTYDKTWDSTKLVMVNHTGQFGDGDPSYDINLHYENSNPLNTYLYNEALYVLDSNNIVYVYDLFDNMWFYSYQFSLEQYSIGLVGMAIDAGQMYIVDDDVVSVYRSLHGTSVDHTPAVRYQPISYTFTSGSTSSSSTNSGDTTPLADIPDEPASSDPIGGPVALMVVDQSRDVVQEKNTEGICANPYIYIQYWCQGHDPDN